VCVCLSVCVCVCLSLCVPVCLCVCISGWVCISVCMYKCVCECTCVPLNDLEKCLRTAVLLKFSSSWNKESKEFSYSLHLTVS